MIFTKVFINSNTIILFNIFVGILLILFGAKPYLNLNVKNTKISELDY